VLTSLHTREAIMSDIRWSEQELPDATGDGRKAELADIICTLLDGKASARLLELHYWSEEPQLMEIMRVVAGLTDEARASLRAFLARASDPQEITVTADQLGQLTLSAPVRCAAVLPFRRPRKSATRPKGA
jgi:hypothetical protein